jgi:hypothetical protein
VGGLGGRDRRCRGWQRVGKGVTGVKRVWAALMGGSPGRDTASELPPSASGCGCCQQPAAATPAPCWLAFQGAEGAVGAAGGVLAELVDIHGSGEVRRGGVQRRGNVTGVFGDQSIGCRMGGVRGAERAQRTPGAWHMGL